MYNEEVMSSLFEGLKDSPIYTTLKTGFVKIRTGATYGDWAEIGRLIDPKADRPILVAENFMYHQLPAAKELRTRIAQWRKDTYKPDPAKVLFIDGACVTSLELEEFSLDCILDADDINNIQEARANKFRECVNNVVVVDVLGHTTVTLFDCDGAADFFIGTGFVGPRDI